MLVMRMPNSRRLVYTSKQRMGLSFSNKFSRRLYNDLGKIDKTRHNFICQLGLPYFFLSRTVLSLAQLVAHCRTAKRSSILVEGLCRPSLEWAAPIEEYLMK